MGPIRKKRLAAAIALTLLAAALGAGLLLFITNPRHPLSALPGLENYELTYQAEIEKYAQKYGLDPYLVAAVIHVESGNRPDAVSPAGAAGLMQIMPETGDWIAEMLHLDPAGIDLHNPDTSIEFGCWYLRFLGGLFEERSTITAAYNAGQGRVSAWLADAACSQDGKTLTDIPYEETRNYVKKIDTAYKKYEELYPDAF